MNVSELYASIREQAAKVIVGQETVFEQIVIAFLSGGHILLEGVPGTAKTLMAKTLAHLTDSAFGRIQFTADLMPSDIIGTQVYDLDNGRFNLRKGPIFTQILLADEINRAPAKTQSALLEAMEERQVTIDGVGYPLREPFMVLATQNPVEYEGTYPLPEAQIDRFLFKVLVGYPADEAEREVLQRYHQGFDAHKTGSSRYQACDLSSGTGRFPGRNPGGNGRAGGVRIHHHARERHPPQPGSAAWRKSARKHCSVTIIQELRGFAGAGVMSSPMM